MLKCFKRVFNCNRVNNKKEIESPNKTYVLKLRNEKYYVGESDNIKRRIWAHSNDNGSAWTKIHAVESRIDGITTTRNFDELVQTLEMMKEYGIDNVRGSMFTKPFPLDPSEKITAAQLYCELHNLCRKCGSNEHFIGGCASENVSDWVHNFGGRLEIQSLNSQKECYECEKDISSLPPNYKYCRPCFIKVNGYKKNKNKYQS